MAKNRTVEFNVDYAKSFLIDWKKKHNAPSMQWISRVIARRSDRYLETCFTRGTIGVDDLNRICKNTGMDKKKALKIDTIKPNPTDRISSTSRIATRSSADIANELAQINETLEEILFFIKGAWR